MKPEELSRPGDRQRYSVLTTDRDRNIRHSSPVCGRSEVRGSFEVVRVGNLQPEENDLRSSECNIEHWWCLQRADLNQFTGAGGRGAVGVGNVEKVGPGAIRLGGRGDEHGGAE